MEKVKNDPFNIYVGLSLIGHILVVAVFTIKVAFFPSTDILIQNAIKVDMVALPDKKAAPPAQAKAEKAKTKPVVIKETPKKDTKAKQNKALQKLKAMSALENLKNEVKKQEQSQQKHEPEEPTLYKGNIVTTGSDLKGLAKLQYDEYFAKLEKHVKEQWVLPQWLADADYRVQVKVTIDDRGYVTSKEVVTSSGNTVFDNMALAALEKSSPCPIAPSKLQVLIATEGINFNFP